MGERRQSGLYGRFDVLFARLLVNADYLGRLGRIDGTDLAGGFDAFAADNQVVLATELSAHFLDSGAHFTHVFFLAEIDKWLVLERAFVKADLHMRRGFYGCHSRSFLGSKHEFRYSYLQFYTARGADRLARYRIESDQTK